MPHNNISTQNTSKPAPNKASSTQNTTARNESYWDQHFEATYKIKIQSPHVYEGLEKELREICLDFQKDYPHFTPRIRFSKNGNNSYGNTIEIGHSYVDFYSFIPESYRPLFPNPQDLHFTPSTNFELSVGRKGNIEVFAQASAHRLTYNNKVLIRPFPIQEEEKIIPKKNVENITVPKDTTRDNL